MVETADRPGLLVDLVKIITDINITVQSREFDTEVKKSVHVGFMFVTCNGSLKLNSGCIQGLLAKAKFHVSYRNEPIMKALQQVHFSDYVFI